MDYDVPAFKQLPNTSYKNKQKEYGYLEYFHNPKTRHKQASFTKPWTQTRPHHVSLATINKLRFARNTDQQYLRYVCNIALRFEHTCFRTAVCTVSPHTFKKYTVD